MEVLQGKVFDILRGSSIAVASDGTAYSQAFELKNDVSFGLELQFASDGYVNVKVELEQSFELPATEQAADGNYVIPDNKTDSPISEGITDELVHLSNYQPNPTPYARLKLTGLTSGNANDASTVLSKARLYEVA